MYARLCDIVIAIDLSGRLPDKSAAIPPRPAPICAQHTDIYRIGTERGRLKGLSIEGVLNDNYIHLHRDVYTSILQGNGCIDVCRCSVGWEIVRRLG